MPLARSPLPALLVLALISPATSAQSPEAEIDRLAAAVGAEVVAWRQHLHEHPELSNREIETAKYIAARLRSFGLEPQTGARTGVVAMIAGGRPGPTIALRADMDALPIREETGLPFASRATGEHEGQMVGVMHACGHDAHMAMLLGAARVLTQVADRLPGSVKLLFQPAEEGVPAGERPAGAELMVQEGVMQGVEAVFALHVSSRVPTGAITYRSGPFMAAADDFDITVSGPKGRAPGTWRIVNPLLVGSQTVTALEGVAEGVAEMSRLPAFISIGQFQSGVRHNTIPETARLAGTIRTFDEHARNEIHARIRETAEQIASAAGATVDVSIARGYPVTSNDPALTARMLPTLQRVAPGKVAESELVPAAEDFSYYQREAPGLYILLGVTPPEHLDKAPGQHTPRFDLDERALATGVRALAHLAVDYLVGAGVSRSSR